MIAHYRTKPQGHSLSGIFSGSHHKMLTSWNKTKSTVMFVPLGRTLFSPPDPWSKGKGPGAAQTSWKQMTQLSLQGFFPSRWCKKHGETMSHTHAHMRMGYIVILQLSSRKSSDGGVFGSLSTKHLNFHSFRQTQTVQNFPANYSSYPWVIKHGDGHFNIFQHFTGFFQL